MRFYKLLHLPSGMFFKPSKHNAPENLSKNGKMYKNRPSLGETYNHPHTRYSSIKTPVVRSQWVIVEYSGVEVARTSLASYDR
jgi:hypothetical protein